MGDDDTTVVINGETVIISEDNTFTTEVDLIRGLNVVTIEAKRRYSRPAVIYRRVVFDPQGQSAALPDIFARE